MGFSTDVKVAAYERQKHRCASCRLQLTLGIDKKIIVQTQLYQQNKEGNKTELYQEKTEAHHIVPKAIGGPDSVENCAIVCKSCHINAHEGGRYRKAHSNKLYADLPRGFAEKISILKEEYKYYE